MSAASIIINQYAKAAFNSAKKANSVEQFLADLKLFSDNFSAGISEELSNPVIAKADIVNLVRFLAEKIKIGENVTEFLIIVAQARRISLVGKIYQNFLQLAKSDKNILEVKLFVADNLSELQLNQIKTLLQKKYSQNIIEINQIIKKDLLGGILIQIGSMVIDASLKNQLLKIATSCNEIVS